MTGMSKVPAMAARMLAGRSVRALINDLIETNKSNSPEIYTVRGWIMDELERRDEHAYWEWVENGDNDNDLFRFFDC